MTPTSHATAVADPDLQRAIEAVLAGRDPAEARCTAMPVAASARRSVHALAAPSGARVVVKRFSPPRGATRQLRERAKRALGRAAAGREWRALCALHASGVEVPVPHLRARLTGGDEVIVMGEVATTPLAAALQHAPRTRRAVLRAIGRAISQLHAAGYAHGDLHAGNLHFDLGLAAGEARAVDAPRTLQTREADPGTASASARSSAAGPALQVAVLDLQRARRVRNGAGQLRDLGSLDASLERAGFSLGDRVCVRRAALADHSEAEQRSLVRRVASAADAFARDQARGRTRRCLVPGRRFAPVSLAGWRGFRLRSFDERDLASAVAAHHNARGEHVLKGDHRARVTAVDAGAQGRVVVKAVLKSDLGRRLADRLRGSPARRAWVGGHGLAARGLRAATPLAFLERRRFGLPVESLVVLEDLAAHPTALEALEAASDETTRGALVDALTRCLIALHRRGVLHGDLQATHVFAVAGEPTEAALIDLEGVRFAHPISAGDRIRALAELNASLPDACVDLSTRRRAFERYAAALPFGPPGDARAAREALERVVNASLARGHRWRGEGCEQAAPR